MCKNKYTSYILLDEIIEEGRSQKGGSQIHWLIFMQWLTITLPSELKNLGEW